jgi:hypothetical protein
MNDVVRQAFRIAAWPRMANHIAASGLRIAPPERLADFEVLLERRNHSSQRSERLAAIIASPGAQHFLAQVRVECCSSISSWHRKLVPYQLPMSSAYITARLLLCA